MIKVQQLTPGQWSPLSQQAHLIVFKEHKPSEWDRIDFALLTEKDGNIRAYVTCREISHDTLYWQYGGAFPNIKGSIYSIQDMDAFLGWCRERYARVTFLVENTNYPMLKMAMRSRFQIAGVRVFKGSILLEHLLEFPSKEAA